MSASRPRRVADPVRDVSWMTEAACVGKDPELFHPCGTSGPASQQERDAKKVCAGCPVARACLAWSLAMGLDSGIFGGLNELERRELARHYRRVLAGAAREQVAS